MSALDCTVLAASEYGIELGSVTLKINNQQRVRVKGRQVMRRFDPGTLLNQRRVHKTKKHTGSAQ